MQQPHQPAELQHLAHLRQDLVPHLGASVLQHQSSQTVSAHNPWAAEAALEAHLQRQQQAGLAEGSAVQQHQQ